MVYRRRAGMFPVTAFVRGTRGPGGSGCFAVPTGLRDPRLPSPQRMAPSSEPDGGGGGASGGVVGTAGVPGPGASPQP